MASRTQNAVDEAATGNGWRPIPGPQEVVWHKAGRTIAVRYSRSGFILTAVLDEDKVDRRYVDRDVPNKKATVLRWFNEIV